MEISNLLKSFPRTFPLTGALFKIVHCHVDQSSPIEKIASEVYIGQLHEELATLKLFQSNSYFYDQSKKFICLIQTEIDKPIHSEHIQHDVLVCPEEESKTVLDYQLSTRETLSKEISSLGYLSCLQTINMAEQVAAFLEYQTAKKLIPFSLPCFKDIDTSHLPLLKQDVQTKNIDAWLRKVKKVYEREIDIVGKKVLETFHIEFVKKLFHLVKAVVEKEWLAAPQVLFDKVSLDWLSAEYSELEDILHVSAQDIIKAELARKVYHYVALDKFSALREYDSYFTKTLNMVRNLDVNSTYTQKVLQKHIAYVRRYALLQHEADYFESFDSLPIEEMLHNFKHFIFNLEERHYYAYLEFVRIHQAVVKQLDLSLGLRGAYLAPGSRVVTKLKVEMNMLKHFEKDLTIAFKAAKVAIGSEPI